MTKTANRVLVVDDEETICWSLRARLEEDGLIVETASSAEQGLASAERDPPDLVVMDVRLPGMDGLTAMARLRERRPTLPVIIITAFGALDVAVAAIRGGATDYLVKPFDLEQATDVVKRALERLQDVTPPAPVETGDLVGRELIGRSPAMQEVFKRIAVVAQSDVPVLISGESGTGKELVARAIHRHSRRANKPFVSVNLAALSPALIESELFGHVRGAFTGADSARVGLLELAHDATVFFDEAGDIPPNVQVKLLRVLEQREVTPVGDTRARPVNFRVIAATNRDLTQAVRDEAFRRDLFFRLAGFEIVLPPLRERVEDIPVLVEHFLRHGGTSIPAGCTVSDAALEELRRRPWPGNVRELRSAIEHAAILSRGLRIEPAHLPVVRQFSTPAAGGREQLQELVRDWAQTELASPEMRGKLYDALLAVVEPPLFQAVLDSTGQNRAAAAEILGIHRQTLRRRLEGDASS